MRALMKTFFVMAFGVLVPISAQADMTVQDRLAEGQPFAVIAHRSAEIEDMPENSLAWIQAAIALGVDMVHVNPQLTADDHYVLMHDATLNRTTNVEQVFPEGPPNGPTRASRGGKDYVRDYTLEDIQRLLLTGEGSEMYPVPTLREAIEFVDGRVIVVLGLKNYETESLAVALEEVTKDNLLLMDLYYSGTDQSKFRDTIEATGIGAKVTLYRSRNYLADLNRVVAQIGPGLRMVGSGSARLTPEFLARLQELDLPLSISGWNGKEDSALVSNSDGTAWRKAFGTAAAGTTDHPALVLDLLGR